MLWGHPFYLQWRTTVLWGHPFYLQWRTTVWWRNERSRSALKGRNHRIDPAHSSGNLIPNHISLLHEQLWAMLSNINAMQYILYCMTVNYCKIESIFFSLGSGHSVQQGGTNKSVGGSLNSTTHLWEDHQIPHAHYWGDHKIQFQGI